MINGIAIGIKGVTVSEYLKIILEKFDQILSTIQMNLSS